MNDSVVAAITKANSRKALFHFTRARNLPAIAHFDTLLSSNRVSANGGGERRLTAHEVKYDHYSITINAHLRIPDNMLDPATTQEQFRLCLDQHVFLWPTVKDCQKMMDTYTRREPNETFAVLEFDAYSLLLEHYATVKLSKYDSGSSPRFPHLCSYRKSPDMFLPLDSYRHKMNNTVPTKASEIREVLIEDQVINVTKNLRSIYVDNCLDVPENWREHAKPRLGIHSPFE